ncbi:carboxylesterase [Bisporella sp. PMI_857]|nr:carboxylesterase [Bisporella sp. PMI_857]KAH8600588.1 carboxylesterase [Bisporella sp. PMI_857]
MKLSLCVALTTVTSSAWAAVHAIEQRQGNWTVGQVVQTSSGPVTGHGAKNHSDVSEYLGIPFGQAPIGDLRFAAPVRFNGTEPLNGASFGPSCPVKEGGSGYNFTTETIAKANVTLVGPDVLGSFSNKDATYSEDCLYLNVWTKPQVGDAKKAVLVWVYGGGFSGGSSTVSIYNGANIVEEQDVVLVTLNYRLSILGFPGNPAGANNLGLLDQRLAVEWVRDNIESFGGDPSKITLFGQSAGGASVDFYSYAWKDDPIVAGIIPESGNVFGWALPNTKQAANSAWFTVSESLGCGNASSDAAQVLSCMRTKNSSAILNAIPTATATAGILGYFIPTIDDTVVFSNYSTREPSNIPMLVGNNDYEVGYWRTTFALRGLIFPEKFWNLFNLQQFTCPTGLRANASYAADVPIWRYRYFGVFPNLALSWNSGAWHAAEVPMLFNTAPLVPSATTEQISIGKYMRGAWAAFAKDPANGLTNYEDGWPSWDPTKDTLIRLAYNNQTGTNLASGYQYDGWCSYVNVSSIDISLYLNYPDINPSVPPGGLAANTGSPNSTTSSSPTQTGASPSSSTPGSGNSLKKPVAWVLVAALLSVWCM